MMPFIWGTVDYYTWNGNIYIKGPAFVNCKVQAVLVVHLAWHLLIEQGVVVMSVKIICKMQDSNSAFAQNM
jgi:hypothetical protein